MSILNFDVPSSNNIFSCLHEEVSHSNYVGIFYNVRVIPTQLIDNTYVIFRRWRLRCSPYGVPPTPAIIEDYRLSFNTGGIIFTPLSILSVSSEARIL